MNDIVRKNSVELFLIWKVVPEEMPYNDISCLELWQPFCLSEQSI